MKMKKVLSEELLHKMNYYWMALNYLSVGQLYLRDNPLLRTELKMSDVKENIVGHWGTAPGQTFIYTHLNRIIRKYDLNMIYISGPGHGGEALIAASYLEGTYSEVYPDITMDEKGLKKLFSQFSFPGGVSSHVSPEVPGSIHEGGELGYSLSHAYGAVLDHKDLIVACVVGDGEAETGPLATSWHLNKFINPKTDGTVLPILHLNGYKISNPTIFGRMSDKEKKNYFDGCGYKAYIVSGSDPRDMHEKMASALEKCLKDISKIKSGFHIKWPMIILETPKGWSGPKSVMGKKNEGSFRSHQVPVTIDRENILSLRTLEKWLKSYHPELLFDEKGSLKKEYKDWIPVSNRRMSANKVANGGLLLKKLNKPNLRKHEFMIDAPGKNVASDMLELGKYIRDLIQLNPTNFRLFGPDEALSNRLNAVFEVTGRTWNFRTLKSDEFLSEDGRVMDSYLSEHACQGMLEGYLLTGRYGFMHSYEAFIRIVDSMSSQHAKWLKVCSEIPWRKDIASLNYILTSHIWQQDHNGYTHQDPGFLNHLATKKADVTRIYLPIDANTLLSCFDHIIDTKNYINVLIASKHPKVQWFSMEDAIAHCKAGVGELKFISDHVKNPDLVLVSCGDTPNLEIVAAYKILKSFAPKLKIRVINVVDLMRLQSKVEHPHGLTDEEYDQLFTKTKPIIFAFHGYPTLIHMLTYRRSNKNLHVHGYKEEGTITTSFDMRVQNEIDRYHLILNALRFIKLDNKEEIETYCKKMLSKHKSYIKKYGKDMPEVLNFDYE